MELPEEQVLEKLNAVSTAKRLANMVRFITSVLRINLFRSSRSGVHTTRCALVTEFRGIAFERGVIPASPSPSSALVLTFPCRGVEQELHDSSFGKREEIHKTKRNKRKSDLAG